MRKRIGFILLAFALLADAFAEVTVTGLAPRDARAMGTGGASLVFSTGFDSFYGNPAGFAGRRSLTLADASTWVYARPNPAEIRAISRFFGKTPSAEDLERLDSLISTNGLGAGLSAGLGWTGGGLGLGATLVADALAMDYSLASGGASDPAVRARAMANGIAGVAFPIEFSGFTFTVGADVRAFYLIDSFGDWPFDDLSDAWLSGSGFSDLLNAQNVRGGYGLSVDAGATLAFGPLSLGIMVRDYGYNFRLGEATVGEVLVDMALPMTGVIDCTMLPAYTAGAKLVLGDPKGILTSLFVEATDPVATVSGALENPQTIPDSIHAGLVIGVGNILFIRSGLNQGLPSFGMGFDLRILSLDFALFGFRDPLVPELPRTGLAVRAGIRL